MNHALPENSRQLRWMLTRRLGVAAIGIGLIAGGASYWIETYRAEQVAIERVTSGLRHFESPVMQLLAKEAVPEGHDALASLPDRGRLVGLRVFNKDGKLFYESWADIPTPFVDIVRLRRHEWPALGSIHRNWIELSGERLIQVVQPILGKDDSIVGYLEGTSRLSAEMLRAQRDQILSSILTAVAAVWTTTLLLYPLLLAMLRRSTGLSRCLLDSNLSLVRSLGNAVAKRDSDTDAHNYRVTYYAVALAEAMGLSAKDISELVVGAFLHDVGKIGIPDSILLKPGKLTSDEFEIMKTHTLLGIEIIADNPWLQGAAPTIRHHHERFDGTGYPDGLQRDAIPYNARVFAVVDVFDALTSERPYKKPMTLADAMSVIEQDSGKHFDPKVVSAFIEIAPSRFSITNRASDTELRSAMNEMLSRYFKTETDPKLTS